MSLSAGARLGPYEIVNLLGLGGMGEVYRARDTRLGRTVAIKVLPDLFASDSQFNDRFEREARAIASLSHPNICTVHDVGEEAGRRFLVMEHLEGETLSERLRRERIPYHTLLAWATQLTDALALAHGMGILHRDLKPANLFIIANGAIKILDFGLAKRTNASLDAGPTLAGTQVGTAVGTVAYMSPEQARGAAIDGRSDLFSLGAVLYEAATGQPAFSGATSAVIFEAIFSRNISRRSIPAPIPAGFTAVVERLLAKAPENRFPNAEAVRAALNELVPQRDSDPGRTPARIPSLAVLPFADMSAQKDQDYFCEGMADELINAFAKLPDLRVASRTSAFRFKGAADIHQVGKELGVDAVVEGSVRTAGSRLRVSAQLVNVADGYQIWSERFDRQMDDVFEIQDEIARAIVDALRVTLLGGAGETLVKRAADNVEAYQMCLKARYYWHKWTDGGFRKAFELFDQAVQLDPNCALAQFGLADCYTAAGSSGLIGPEFRDKAEALFETALTLDPDLAEAHAIRGILRGIIGWDWLAAEQFHLTALKLNARSAHVNSAYSMHLAVVGRHDEALTYSNRAVELDPLLPTWHVFNTWVHYIARRYEPAIRSADLAIDLDTHNWWARGLRALSLAAQGRAAEGLVHYQASLTSTSPYAVAEYAFVLSQAGRIAEAEEQRYVLIENAKNAHVPPAAVALICAGLGRVDETFSWLARAVEQHDPQMAFYVSGVTAFDAVRSDPRFLDIRRRMGI